MKLKLLEDYDGTTFEVELPLTSRVDAKQAAEELGLPSYIDLSNLATSRAVVTLWAAQNVQRLDLPSDLKRKLVKPIPALLFGGVAVKVHSKTANRPGHALNRSLNDIDFAVRKRDGYLFVKLLLNLGNALGTRYAYFATSGDRWFNALRGGMRYRVHGLSGVEGDGLHASTIDIFCEELPFRHTIKLKEEFENPTTRLYTIGLEKLLLSKLQFIFGLPKERIALLESSGQSFRVLPYEYLKGMVAVGMELKDMKDVAALLIDHEIGEGPEAINPALLKGVLEKDRPFALTVRLNLQNFVEKIEVLVKEGLSPSEASRAAAAAEELLESVPAVDKRWSKPWWNVYVESPGLEGVK